MNRRGTGLVEAIMAAGLTALLVIAALGALSSLQRSTGRFAARALSDQVLRGATHLLRSELGDLAPSAGEIGALGPGSITYRAVRGTGIACGASGGRIHVAASSWAPLRQPAAGRDSLVLLGQPPETEVVVAASGPATAGVCPDGVASMSLPYVVSMPDPASMARYPTPILVSEVMEIRGYESGGEWWIGMRSVSAGEVIQPAHGPIAVNGLAFAALDSAGSPTLLPGLVRHLAVSLRLPSGDSTAVQLDYSSRAWR
jgi:hypothetical protein